MGQTPKMTPHRPSLAAKAQMPAKETTPLTAAGGKWSSGLCSCFSDCTSCLTVCCLKPVALGQLSQKVLGYPCLFVTILLFSLCMLEDLFGLYDSLPDHTHDKIKEETGAAWTNPIACAGACASHACPRPVATAVEMSPLPAPRSLP